METEREKALRLRREKKKAEKANQKGVGGKTWGYMENKKNTTDRLDKVFDYQKGKGMKG